MEEKTLAVVGATGLVGKTVLTVLEEKNLHISNYVFFASKRSANKKIHFLGKEYIIQELTETTFNDNHFDYAIFCAGGSVSKKYAPIASSAGTIVIDNSSTFRMEADVPLIVPEVNPEDISNYNGIISNPNCSTIQAVVALKPLDKKYKIKRIVYSTYQAVSGAGQNGVKDLENTLEGLKYDKFPYPIANNCLPHIDAFLENGYTREEMKMIDETKKILHNNDLKITATTVRVPVLNCHCESINIEFENDFDINELKNLLANSPGVVVEDNIQKYIYPLPTNVSGHDDVYVGRIRRDESVDFGVNIWVVADNVRKGAATNAVQILEILLK